MHLPRHGDSITLVCDRARRCTPAPASVLFLLADPGGDDDDG
eukprot:COSAG01_NODE_44093_length_422_cov_2.758514_1_plen_41_part_01